MAADGESYPDDTALSGPTVISTATIEEVASWYEGITAEGVRRRLRANLEVDGVPAFWEDQLISDHDHGVAFDVGDVRFTGVNPCQRCVVPSRDPYTGEETLGFRTTFLQRREETLPEWVDTTRFDHYFRLMVNTTVSPDERGGAVRVGDEVADTSVRNGCESIDGRPERFERYGQDQTGRSEMNPRPPPGRPSGPSSAKRPTGSPRRKASPSTAPADSSGRS